MKIVLRRLRVYLLIRLGHCFFSSGPGTRSGVHESQRRYLYLCSRRDHHDVQLRRHPGRRRDDR